MVITQTPSWRNCAHNLMLYIFENKLLHVLMIGYCWFGLIIYRYADAATILLRWALAADKCNATHSQCKVSKLSNLYWYLCKSSATFSVCRYPHFILSIFLFKIDTGVNTFIYSVEYNQVFSMIIFMHLVLLTPFYLFMRQQLCSYLSWWGEGA